MALFYAAYFDASGRPERHPFVTTAGAVAPIKKWERFESEWGAILSSVGLTEFHMTDFVAKRGEFSHGWNDPAKRSRLLGDLLGTIKRNVNKQFSVTVEVAAWHAVNQRLMLAELFGAPYSLCGWAVTTQVRRWASRKKARSPVRVFFEKGDSDWGKLETLCKRDTSLSSAPVDIPKTCSRAFQVGDYLAWKARIAATNATDKINKIPDADLIGLTSTKLPDTVLDELKSLRQARVRPGTMNLYGEKALLKLCELNHVPSRVSPRMPDALSR